MHGTGPYFSMRCGGVYDVYKCICMYVKVNELEYMHIIIATTVFRRPDSAVTARCAHILPLVELFELLHQLKSVLSLLD